MKHLTNAKEVLAHEVSMSQSPGWTGMGEAAHQGKVRSLPGYRAMSAGTYVLRKVQRQITTVR